MISILDYGMGNVGSLENMVRRVGGKVVAASTVDEIQKAKKLILPGVGAFDNAITRLNELNWIAPLYHKVINEKTPILCICLGMQLITKESEEGSLPGLGWIDARTVRFHNSVCNLKVPHMGWGAVLQKKPSKLFNNVSSNERRFYFVHSYHVECADKKDILTISTYGYEFVSAIERDNIYATQFHPEKSHKFGMQLVKNFMEL